MALSSVPDPNGPLSARVPSDDSVGQPTKRYQPGAHGISAELAASKEKKSGPYNR